VKITTSSHGDDTVLELAGNLTVLTVGAADETIPGVIDQLIVKGRIIIVVGT